MVGSNTPISNIVDAMLKSDQPCKEFYSLGVEMSSQRHDHFNSGTTKLRQREKERERDRNRQKHRYRDRDRDRDREKDRE